MGEIRIRTRWLRSDSDQCACCEGKHVFVVRPEILESDYASRPTFVDDLVGQIQRAICSYPEGSTIRIRFDQVEG